MGQTPAPPALVQLGRYTQLQLLGQGGMGAVYRAHDPALDRTVAIKVVLEANEEYLARFQREARAIARLSHPHIVQVYDFGEDEQKNPYFVMELIEGQSLAALIKERGPLPVGRVVELLRQAAQGLAEAHAAGIVHRDIKPANMIFDERHGLKLVDFGIARLATSQEDLTSTHAALGTLNYMAPEVLNGQPADARADIYALGLSVFHLLTGRPPFTAPSAVAMAMKQISEPLPDLGREAAGIPPDLCRLIERMTQKNRDKRIQTCDEVAREAGVILSQLTGQTTAPLNSSTRTMTFATPHLPVLVLAAGLGLLASVVLAVVLAGKGKDKGAHLADVRNAVVSSGPTAPPPSPSPAEDRPRPSPGPTASHAAAPSPSAALPTGPVVIAVLKFKNLSADRELDFYSEGLSEQVITTLQSMQVTGPTKLTLVERNQFDEQNLPELKRSKADYIDKATAAQLGKVLGAEVIVQGSFQRVDSQVQVTARFTSLATATILDTVTVLASIATPKDKFAVQDLVAAKLRDKLQALLPRLRP